jgi:hypothetical protein
LKEQRQGAGKIRILHGDTGHISMMQKFQTVHRGGVDPAGAGGRDDDQY